MKKELTTPRAAPVVTVDDVKSHIVVDHTTDDNLIALYIEQATDYVQQYTGRQFGSQVWTVYGNCWSQVQALSFKPITSIVVTYDDEDNTEQTLAADQYLLDDKAYPGYFYPAPEVTWPELYDGPNVARVAVTCGETTLPSSARAAIYLLCGDLYNQREHSNMVQLHEVPLSAKAFLDQLRIAF